jgi:hypothetical protein
VLSRTVGLPGFKEHEWELLGIVSLVVEGGFLALFAIREQRAVAPCPDNSGARRGRAPGPPPARSLSGLAKEPGARELELAKA